MITPSLQLAPKPPALNPPPVSKRTPDIQHFFKPPPLVGAGGGYMFSGRPSLRPCRRPSVRL